MASMARQYVRAMRDEMKLFAAWPIGTNIQLGDVGFLSRRGKLFERRTALAEFKVEAPSRRASQPTDVDITLGRSLDIRFKASGTAAPPGSLLTSADVGVSIAFGRGRSTIVRAHTVESSITSLHNLEADLIRVSNDPAIGWHRGYVVVTAVYESTGTTVLLSAGKRSKIDITARAGMAVPFDLADASIGLSAVTGCEKLITALAKPGFVPFFQVHHLIGYHRGEIRLWLYLRSA